MKIVVISLNNPNIYPGLYHLATALAKAGAYIYFLSRVEPKNTNAESGNLEWLKISTTGKFMQNIPFLRSNYHGILLNIRSIRPDLIIAQHEYLIPSLVYKYLYRKIGVKVAGYFSDYYKSIWHTELLKRFAHLLDAYIDICDMRLEWRQEDWPRLRAKTFIIRQAPYLWDEVLHQSRQGPAKVVLTGSNLLLKMNRDRLSRFLARLCGHGISVDWYLPGTDEVRSAARSLTSHPLYTVHSSLEKSRLITILGDYDAGLFWAPIADCDPSRPWDKSVFLSAASNKIGEYIAAGLMVAHTGNPGLSYLPCEVSTAFDPINPEVGADQLAAALSDRTVVTRKRDAAWRYHRDEMNFEAQVAPFIRYAIEGMEGRATGRK